MKYDIERFRKTSTRRTQCAALAAFILFFGNAAGAQQDNDRSPTYGIGARAASLAEAYATEYADVLSMYWNPASLAFIERNSLTFDYLNDVDNGTAMGTFSIPFRLSGNDVMGVGLTAMQVGIKDGAGAIIRGSRYGLNFSSARLLTSTLSFGARVAVQHGQTEDSRLWTGSTVFGLLYSPSPEISYAIVYSGIGLGMEHSYDLQGPPKLVFSKVSLPSTLHLGLAMRYPSSRTDRVVTVSLANEKIFGSPGIVYKGAIEVNATRYAALRAGYVAAPSMASPRYGVGFFLNRFQIDYAYATGEGVQRFHQLTLSILLGESKRIEQD